MTDGPPDIGDTQLDRTVVVLHEPQDVVNIALVIRAMKNMGLSRMRLVRPAEFDAWRVAGIAHDTEDMIERVEFFDDLASALAESEYVLGATARRRTTRQDWWTPDEAARALTAEGRRLALVFGREDRGLSNEALDLCDGLVRISTNPEHPSLNLAHATLLVCYELRKAVMEAEGMEPPDMGHKRRQRTPPATHEELESLFDTWERAMDEIGLFHGIDPLPKMRSFRAIFQRADLDRRELGLVQAAAYEILHYAARERERLRSELESD